MIKNKTINIIDPIRDKQISCNFSWKVGDTIKLVMWTTVMLKAAY